MPIVASLMMLVIVSGIVASPVDAASKAKAKLEKTADADALFREGYGFLLEEEFEAARASFAKVSPESYDLGDYVVYFTGLSHAREKKRAEAESSYSLLEKKFSASPLIPYLAHEIALLFASTDDMQGVTSNLARSRGLVTGPDRKSEEAYLEARLQEASDNVAATESHFRNASANLPHEGARLSLERLWSMRSVGGGWVAWAPGSAKLLRLASALAKASEADRARIVYAESLGAASGDEEKYLALLDFAEFLRKQRETGKAKVLLDGALPSAPAAFRNEVLFLRARVDWRAGRLKDARDTFLSIADNALKQVTAEKARYLAAWVAEEEGDIAASLDDYAKLANASDEETRKEALFRRGWGLYRLKRFDEAASAFATAYDAWPAASGERARNAFWRAASIFDGGKVDEARPLLEKLASDPNAGVYLMLARKKLGRDPFALVNAEASGETAACAAETDRLWDRVRSAPWTHAEASAIKRAERLVALGVVEYAVREADRVNRESVRATLGLTGGATAGLFRYLAGDLRGGIRESNPVANDPAVIDLLDKIQFPLASAFVGDCEKRRSGIDPLVLHSVIRQESLFQENAISSAGAVGLMQLMPATAAETARREKMKAPKRSDLTRPQLNVTLGAAYFAKVLKDFDGDYLRAVAAYNAGEKAVDKWWEEAGHDSAAFVETISYRETRLYVRRVAYNIIQYYMIYRPSMFARFVGPAPVTAPVTTPVAPVVPDPAPAPATAPVPATAPAPVPAS